MEAIVRADGRQLRLIEGQEFELNHVAGSRLVGTMLAQALFLPSAAAIAWIANYV